ncbi:hypothetical protein DRJ16_07110 [Candidatus Woesearchaeota archaeon]|nr:MAG: hypothetical protein DRJ16_07110 [Candidatus Woesearchaeota archaeon]
MCLEVWEEKEASIRKGSSVKILGWLSLFCLAGAIISFIELVYERFNEMKGRIEDVRELMIAKFEDIEKGLGEWRG